MRTLLGLILVCSAYGSVYKGIHKETGFVVAVKELNVEGADMEEIKSEVCVRARARVCVRACVCVHAYEVLL